MKDAVRESVMRHFLDVFLHGFSGPHQSTDRAVPFSWGRRRKRQTESGAFTTTTSTLSEPEGQDMFSDMPCPGEPMACGRA